MSLPEAECSANAALQRYYPCVVIAIAFITVGMAFGARNAFAVFLVAVVEDLHWSRGLASGALLFGSVMWTLAARSFSYGWPGRNIGAGLDAG